MLLAQLCAENELAKIRLARQMPGVGDTSLTCEQAGRSLRVSLVVRPTPNPNFRRVDAQVLDDLVPIWRLTTVVGRY
jgi:general secretion pathway protein I